MSKDDPGVTEMKKLLSFMPAAKAMRHEVTVTIVNRVRYQTMIRRFSEDSGISVEEMAVRLVLECPGAGITAAKFEIWARSCSDFEVPSAVQLCFILRWLDSVSRLPD